GAPSYTIDWKDETGAVISHDSTVVVAPTETTFYTVTITDGCGFTYDTIIHYTITTPELLIDSIVSVRVCPYTPVEFTVYAHGGYGQYYYQWNNGTTTQSISVAPKQTTTYTVTVTDECQTYSVSTTATAIIQVPKADFEVTNYPPTQGVDVMFQNTSSSNSVIFDWDFGDTLNPTTSTLKHPNHIYEEPGGYVIRLVVTSDLGCNDTVYKAIEVMPEYYIYVPNAFTPNGDRHNQYFEASTINIADFNIMIYNRWGERIFESNDKQFRWDGTYKGKMVPDDVYVWIIDFMSNDGIEGRLTGHIAVIR
ncbi:MAG TPA: gliding motility-associated C-terminal domain-containing protein, partial [Crocinitomicaceae bacterium]|nr:gliding motility-associated C-terminal domain-containing protein [Crocinitomicaceae bacterium]